MENRSRNILTQPNVLSAYLYLQMAEYPPENAPDEWFAPRENSVSVVDTTKIESFLENTEILLQNLESMDPDSSEEEIQTLFYDAAKATFGEDKKMIRSYFIWLYHVIFGYDSGPRWGIFIRLMGIQRFVDHTRNRFSTLLS